MTAQLESIPYPAPDYRPPDSAADLSDLCQDLFNSFARSDQRRWGEVYVRGLVSLPGRKTIRRISDHVVGWRADQSLQQFVNQSPWRWEPVRRGLAHEVANLLRPRAVVIEEAVFPKNGSNSVGVARQFAPSFQRMLNCQLGLAAFLAGDQGNVPVDWRLQLPKEWNEDGPRRLKSRVPPAQRYRPSWAHALDLVDELAAWDLPALPVLIDARHERQVEPLLRGLEERERPYVVQVGEDTPVTSTLTAAALGGPLPRTAGGLVRQARGMGRMTMNWRETNRGRTTVSQFVFAPVHDSARRATLPQAYRPSRRVLAEWGSGRAAPDAVHLTNITQVRLPDLVRLVRLGRQPAEDLARLQEDCGLAHFEGRSYAGWHHHVTLVSVAHAYRLFRRTGRAPLTDPWLRSHA